MPVRAGKGEGREVVEVRVVDVAVAEVEHRVVLGVDVCRAVLSALQADDAEALHPAVKAVKISNGIDETRQDEGVKGKTQKKALTYQRGPSCP